MTTTDKWFYHPPDGEKKGPREQPLAPEEVYQHMADTAVHLHGNVYRRFVQGPEAIPTTPEHTLPFATGWLAITQMYPHILAAKDPTILERLSPPQPDDFHPFSQEDPFLFSILSESLQPSHIVPSPDVQHAVRQDPTGVTWLSGQIDAIRRQADFPPSYAEVLGMRAAVGQIRRLSQPPRERPRPR